MKSGVLAQACRRAGFKESLVGGLVSSAHDLQRFRRDVINEAIADMKRSIEEFEDDVAWHQVPRQAGKGRETKKEKAVRRRAFVQSVATVRAYEEMVATLEGIL